MRRRAAAQRAEEVSEARDLVLVELENLAHDVLLELGVVDTHRAAADFLPIKYEVVVLPTYTLDLAAFQRLDVLGDRGREWVVC